MEISALETEYNGYRFRSRLEARWAVFFDTLEIPYEYEPEGFDLKDFWYLPDFLLGQCLWAEIKPKDPNEIEILKCELLARGTGNRCLILVETPDWKGMYQSVDKDGLTRLRPIEWLLEFSNKEFKDQRLVGEAIRAARRVRFDEGAPPRAIPRQSDVEVVRTATGSFQMPHERAIDRMNCPEWLVQLGRGYTDGQDTEH